MKILYLRVSNDELDESTQLPEILSTFNLREDDCVVLRERVSAYKEKSQDKRTEFKKLKEWIEQGVVSDLYVYSLERIERNIIRMFEFFFFCEANDCTIHGVLQPSLELKFEDSPMGTFSKYNQVLIYGLLGENESYMIKKRVEKSIVKGNVTQSSYGNKWGSKFRDLQGNRIELPIKKIESMKRRIKFLLDEKNMRAIPIIEDIAKKFGVKLSVMTISRVKNGKIE